MDFSIPFWQFLCVVFLSFIVGGYVGGEVVYRIVARRIEANDPGPQDPGPTTLHVVGSCGGDGCCRGA